MLNLIATPTAPPARDPRYRLRCDVCGRFAGKGAHTSGGFAVSMTHGDDWIDFACTCARCLGATP